MNLMSCLLFSPGSPVVQHVTRTHTHTEAHKNSTLHFLLFCFLGGGFSFFSLHWSVKMARDDRHQANVRVGAVVSVHSHPRCLPKGETTVHHDSATSQGRSSSFALAHTHAHTHKRRRERIIFSTGTF